MESLAHFHFIRPLWLLLAFPAVGIWWMWRKGSDPLRGWREQMDPTLLGALVSGLSQGEQWRTSLLLAVWFLAILVVAGPTWKPEPNPFAEDASPLIVLLKSDVSMERNDLTPSRLERAKLKIADLAQARRGQPLGLIAYAGSAHLVLPPTKDTTIVAQMAREISPDIMPVPGDHLELALSKAGELLAKQSTPGSILVVADTFDGDLSALAEAQKKYGAFPVEFLALNEAGSSEDESLRKAAGRLKTKVEPVSADDTDIKGLVRAAARPPVSREAILGKGGHWEEGGWYFLPMLALWAILAFRREAAKPKEAIA